MENYSAILEVFRDQHPYMRYELAISRGPQKKTTQAAVPLWLKHVYQSWYTTRYMIYGDIDLEVNAMFWGLKIFKTSKIMP